MVLLRNQETDPYTDTAATRSMLVFREGPVPASPADATCHWRRRSSGAVVSQQAHPVHRLEGRLSLTAEH